MAVNLVVKGKPDPIRMRAIRLAVPTDAGGWSVVAAQYSSP